MENYVLVALLISLLWGTSPLVYKHLLSRYNPITIIIFSGVIYAACVFVFGCFHMNILLEDYNRMNGNDIWWIALTAIFAVFIANVLQITVLKDANASVVSPIIYTCPIFTLLLAYMFFNAEPNRYCILGVLLIVLGVLCISVCSNTTTKECIDLNKLFKLG